MVLANYEEVLTGCSIVAGPNVGDSTIADFEAVNNGEAEEWSSGLHGRLGRRSRKSESIHHLEKRTC
jgi:hypothetical protein